MKDQKNIYIAALFVLLLISLSGLVFSFWYTLDQQRQYEQRISNLNLDVARQRSERDQIRDIWEKTTVQNDLFVRTQTSQRDAVDGFIDEIRRTVRFVNTRPDILATANEQNFTAKLNTLEREMQKFEQVVSQNTTFKENAKEKVDAIYLAADQSQSNRADPNKGVR